MNNWYDMKNKWPDSYNNNSGEASEQASKVAQSCPTLCDPMGGGLPDSSVHGIPRQQYWSGLPFPFPGDLPDPGIEPGPLTLQADALPSESPGKPHKVMIKMNVNWTFVELYILLLIFVLSYLILMPIL